MLTVRRAIGWRVPLVRAQQAPLAAMRAALAAWHNVARDQRFRALERRHVADGLRLGASLTILTAFLHLAAFGLLFPVALPGLLAVHGAEAGVAVIALALPPLLTRRRPELAALAIALTLVVGDLALVKIEPRLALLAAGYLVLLPGLVALVVGWGPLAQARFSVAALAAAAVAITTAWTSQGAVARLVLLLAVLIGVGGSFAGTALLRQHRISAFLLRQRLGAMRLRAEHQRQELERLNEALGTTARTDALTGTGNRLRIDDDLATLHGRLARYGQEIGLIVLDLDHFKAVNDHFGHLAGDDVLRRVAQALTATIRSGDAVYRYGGEEFLVVVAGQSLKGAVAAADRLRAAIEALAIPNPGNLPSGIVTTSAGVTTIGPTEGRRDPAAWLRRADQALYVAKASGRNRVMARPAPRASREPRVEAAATGAAADGLAASA